MPYTPSTTAQNIATASGNNMASLSTPLTALQTSIAGGNLAPAAYIDGFSANTYIEVGSGGAPAFQNSWVNYGAPYNTAAFFKDACGVVRIKGLIKSGVMGSACFTLPAGYRPPAGAVFAVIGANPGDVIGRLDVAASGALTPVTGGNGYFSIEVSFYATQ